MQELLRYSNSTIQNYQVLAEVMASEDFLEIVFQVDFQYELVTSPQFRMGSYQNWGLWEFDVVEVFLTREPGERLPYIELQISPLGQTFALLINTPRVETSYPEHLSFESNARVENGKWTSILKIPVAEIPGKEKVIYGNFTACLGPSGQREYFSLAPLEKIDFHQPKLFLALMELSS